MHEGATRAADLIKSSIMVIVDCVKLNYCSVTSSLSYVIPPNLLSSDCIIILFKS